MKNEKGAIAVIVLVSLIFFVSFLVSTYLILANKAQSQMEIIHQTQAIYDNSNSITDVYRSYFATDVVPIYTVEQLLEIGKEKNIIINEAGGKIYKFGENDTYILMNDLEFDANEYQDELNNEDWYPIGDREGVNFEGNGHTITVKHINNLERTYTEENNYAMYYTIDDYVTTDLILWLDGIENTRDGHSDNTILWEDISGNDEDITLHDIVWNEKCAIFNGTTSYGMGEQRNFFKRMYN